MLKIELANTDIYPSPIQSIYDQHDENDPLIMIVDHIYG